MISLTYHPLMDIKTISIFSQIQTLAVKKSLTTKFLHRPMIIYSGQNKEYEQMQWDGGANGVHGKLLVSVTHRGENDKK